MPSENVVCSVCGAQNPTAARFCGDCGTPLALACPACRAPIVSGKRFCNACGEPVTAAAPVPAGGQQAPVAERRLVSLLFADLVGFTARSENRDAEETREFLSQYFETCERVIHAYLGVEDEQGEWHEVDEEAGT